MWLGARVQDERPPPVITITNPSAPAPLSDVIGVEPTRAPRRLTWRQRGLAALAVASLGTAAAGVWGVAHLHEAQRLDAESVREVHVIGASVDTPGLGFSSLGVNLLNQGPHPVTVLAAVIRDRDAVTLTARGNALTPNDPTFVRFRSAPCPKTAPHYSRAGGAVALRVRTYRGRTTTVPLSDSEAAASLRGLYYVTTVTKCRLYPPGASLEPVGFPRAARAGRDLRLTLSLRNRSRSERTLTGFRVTGGLVVASSSAPVVFPGGERLGVTLTLRVASCSTARVSWAFALQQDGTTPAYQVLEADGALTTTVDGDDRVGDQGFLVSAGEVDGISTWVRDVCRR